MSVARSDAWRVGHRLLRTRVDSVPEQLRAAARTPVAPLPPHALRARSCVLTGVGSSAGHARLLARLLADEGLPSRFESVGALARGAPPGSEQDLLIVFSQGLSPNARFAFQHAARYRACILVTGEPESGSERAAALRELAEHGVRIWPVGAAPEFGLLLRVVGPALATLAALRLAAALRPGSPALRRCGEAEIVATTEQVARRIEAVGRFVRGLPPEAVGPFARAPVLLASGGNGAALENTRLKLVEGLLLDPPPVQDLLEFAHGGLQQSLARGAREFWCFEAADERCEPELAALTACLDPEVHKISRIRSELPDFLTVFEYEAWVDAFVLRGLEARELDPADWPGKALDAPLYELAPSGLRQPRRAPDRSPSRALAHCRWPEIDAHLAAGDALALVPLGSTEQHGAHLAFGTDTRLAEELAERLGSRLPGAVALPALPLGCASEHLDFRGTLSLSEDTLERILQDLVEGLGRHGFADALVFSAHGGNTPVLRSVEARLAEAARRGGLHLLVFHDLARVTERLHAIAVAEGIAAERAGHHAGEAETSMLLRVEPSWVGEADLAEGYTLPETDPQALFYPSLRARVPGGVVGDPREALAERGERYLEAWVDVLEEALLAWKKRAHTKGIQKP